MEYSKIGLIAIILHAIINADSLFGKGDGTPDKVRERYRFFLLAVLLFYGSDIFWGVFLKRGPVSVAYVCTVAFFVTMGATVFLWIRYIRAFLNQNNFWSKLLNVVAWTLFVFEMTVLLFNCFYPIMFSFNEEGQYVTSRARHAVLDIQIALFAVVGLYTLIRAARFKDRDRSHHIAVGLSGMIMAFFICLQVNFPMTPFYSMGLLIATSIMHSFVLVDEKVESSRKLSSYRKVAYKDTLTGVRNANAYAESKAGIDNMIRIGSLSNFGVIVLDLNDLKKVNDTQGHDAGDMYIKDACNLICHTFKHSPVFRIGGDEFVVFLMNEDYVNREQLAARFYSQTESNLNTGGPVIASGMSIFEPGKDKCYDCIFERADDLMYIRKKDLKQLGSFLAGSA